MVDRLAARGKTIKKRAVHPDIEKPREPRG